MSPSAEDGSISTMRPLFGFHLANIVLGRHSQLATPAFWNYLKSISGIDKFCELKLARFNGWEAADGCASIKLLVIVTEGLSVLPCSITDHTRLCDLFPGNLTPVRSA